MTIDDFKRPSLDDFAAWFREESGVVRLRAGADWLGAGGDANVDAALAGEIEAELTNALPELAGDLDALAGRARRAFIHADEQALGMLAVDAWDLLCLRDTLADLRDAKRDVVCTHAAGDALAAFDAALDGLEPWLEDLRDRRLEQAKRPGKTGRRWWEPKPLDLSEVDVPELPAALHDALWKPSADEIEAWRRGDLGPSLARLVAHHVKDEAARAANEAAALPEGVIRLSPARTVRVRTKTGTAGGHADKGEERLPDVAAQTMVDLDDRGTVSVGAVDDERVVVKVFLWDTAAFEVDLLDADGKRLEAEASGQVGNTWWGRVAFDVLGGASLTVRVESDGFEQTIGFRG